MHGAIGHFKELLQRRRARLEKTEARFDKRNINSKVSDFKTKLNFSKPSDSQLRKIKTNIRSEKKNNKS